eukprot:g6183.t1
MEQTAGGGELKVLVTVDDQAFVEYADGTRAWVSADSVGIAGSGLEGESWREATTAALAAVPASPVAVSAPCCSSVADDQVFLVRQLFGTQEIEELYALAADCLEQGWGTTRSIWGGALAQAVQRRDGGGGGGGDGGDGGAGGGGGSGGDDGGGGAGTGALTQPALDACFKQADALVYHGAAPAPAEAASGGGSDGTVEGDWVGWHDHAGESVCFAVVMLADPAQFTGGAFCCRRSADHPPRTVPLGLGDAVFCLSPTEHCVRPVTSGVRCSLNVDFWAVAHDRRSDNDRY